VNFYLAYELISRAPSILKCFMAAFKAIKGGLVTYGNFIRSSTPKDFKCSKVYSNGDFIISGVLNKGIFENKAVEKSL
jgi:hypothetical protein